MSDGLTDGYRAEAERRERNDFFSKLCDYLCAPLSSSEESKRFEDFLQSAQVYLWGRRRPFFLPNCPVNLSSEDFRNWFRGFCTDLKGKSDERWAALLSAAHLTSSFRRLKALSPFADKVIFFASKYHDDANVPQVVVDDAIDLVWYVADNKEIASGEYLVVMDKPELIKIKAE